MDEWQPIETLEPDETKRYLVGNRFWVEIGSFVPRKPGDSREGSGWECYHGDISPTHYMPLPERPAPVSRAPLPDTSGAIVIAEGTYSVESLGAFFRRNGADARNGR